MANPPPLPFGRGGPPPLPNRGGKQPPILPGYKPKDPSKFDLNNAARVSTRGVSRATGTTTGMMTWVAFDSTNVNQGRFEPQYDLDGKKTGKGIITLEFVNGAMYEYPGRSEADWLDIFESSSKGRFAYYQIRGKGKSVKGMGLWKPFKQTRQAWRSRAQIAAIVKKREPVGKHKARTYTVGGKRGAFGKGGKRIASVH